MSYRTGNAIKVGPGYGYPAQFDPGPDSEKVYKLDINVSGVSVLMQVLEHGERGWYQDGDKEILLPQGFHSKPFVTPLWAWRFKEWEGDTFFGKRACTISFVAYA